MQSIISLFYHFLQKNKNNFTAYQQWQIDFTAIHGELDSQRKLEITALNRTYQIDCQTEDDIFVLVFCLETYYVIILHLLAFRAVFPQNVPSLAIFSLDFFKQKGIENYTCKNYFYWFLQIETFEKQLDKIEYQAQSYKNNGETDSIRPIFEAVFPTPVRHAMGEFYTPDWLAHFVIKTVTENDTLAHQKTYLDPTCGSGTFIFNVIKQFQKASDNHIFFQVFGIDLNPVSVLAAKTNYLLLYSQCFDFEEDKKLTIPIFYADAIQAKFQQTSTVFEGITFPPVDYLVGNPPWVNWEYLPNTYKLNTKHLWHHYNLFNIKGLSASFIKEDISVLLTYVALDKYLKKEGKLGFVVKETLFKSIKQGEGFRKFHLAPTNTPLNPYRVDDLTLFKPFKDAVNRTALLFIQKGEKVNYPVNYMVWKPTKGKNSMNPSANLAEVLEHFELLPQKAQPSQPEKQNSGWMTLEDGKLNKSALVLGKSEYQARTGTFTGGANGIFWLSILEKKENVLIVQNLTERAKNKMKTFMAEIEQDWIFPFLTGNDLSFWEYSYSKYILCPHTAETKMFPIDAKMLASYPKTQTYLAEFQTELINRKGFTEFDKHIQQASYYAIQRVGDYTFAPYKVAWRYICKDFRPAVIEYANDEHLGRKNIIPNEKIIFVGFNDRKAAYYLCGLLSSTLYRSTIESYMVGTQITPSIINRLHLPKFDSQNTHHQAISQLCEQGHSTKNKQGLVDEIDKIVEIMLQEPKYITTLFPL